MTDIYEGELGGGVRFISSYISFINKIGRVIYEYNHNVFDNNFCKIHYGNQKHQLFFIDKIPVRNKINTYKKTIPM